MRVIGLDMSTKAGVAVVDTTTPGLVLHAETVTFPKLTGFERVNALVARVMEIKQEFNPRFAMIEDYAVSKFGGSIITSVEIGTVLRFCLWQEEYRVFDVSPTTLKKFVAGKGNAKKDEMMMHVLKRFGHESRNNDEADAVGLGIMGLALTGAVSYDKPSQEAIKTVRTNYPDWQSCCN